MAELSDQTWFQGLALVGSTLGFAFSIEKESWWKIVMFAVFMVICYVSVVW